MAKKKVKKSEQIRKEIQRMQKEDNTYCDLNSCEPTDFMRGKTNVYQNLINFIDKL